MAVTDSTARLPIALAAQIEQTNRLVALQGEQEVALMTGLPERGFAEGGKDITVGSITVKRDEVQGSGGDIGLSAGVSRGRKPVRSIGRSFWKA